MLLDRDLRAAWHEQAHAAHGPVVGAIAMCDEARTTTAHDHAVYQGSEWAKTLQACLVAWAATDDAHHADTAIKFLRALLDDLDVIGDGKGGDTAARRDSGYAIRNLGPYTALAYDWLHDAPGMTDELRAKARSRWAAWLAWYRASGYRATTAGTNYHAGYAIAATTIAIAEAGDAGASGDTLWHDVVEPAWTSLLAPAFAAGGVLDGGDWPEGWQYGPLSVAELALGARVMRGAGVPLATTSWLDALLRRHVYALSPADQTYAGGDTEAETANLPPHVLTLDAVALGDASADDRKWARGELSRLAIADRDYLLYDALAAVGDPPQLAPRTRWPTSYVAAASRTLYVRSRWDDRASWLVTACAGALDVDHHHPDAGTFVLSRGRDDLIVDPSPYGTLSTLTSNAPTVRSSNLPRDYVPSQGAWGERTGFDFAAQRASGVAVARCNYADQYKMQERASDVPLALRDLVYVPALDRGDAIVIAIDRATTGGDDRELLVRFRVPAPLQADPAHPARTTAVVGGSKIAIEQLALADGAAPVATIRGNFAKDCFAEGTVRGQCDAARFSVTQVEARANGRDVALVHVLSATAAAAEPATATMRALGAWTALDVRGVRDATVLWRRAEPAGDAPLVVPVRPGAAVIVLDAPERDGNAQVVAHRKGDACELAITAGGSFAARPLVVAVDDACTVHDDAVTTGAAPAPRATPRPGVRSPRSGCCGAQAAPGASPVLALLVLAAILRRRAARPRSARSAR